ncbi:hypothetical protein DFH07DRAFT_989162 [Mycena maculata]|uniref:Uncharacterized protein n=1 Tax=Mycena maculata TaxID=230809 RepID=A0AAD7MUV9_9AGAR|nr:hypothetical protein DFH07DRAFT_989162 [Mycena maculata]
MTGKMDGSRHRVQFPCSWESCGRDQDSDGSPGDPNTSELIPSSPITGEGWEYRDQNDGGHDGGHDGGQMAVGICLGGKAWRCPCCGSAITQPRPSEGHHTPSNEGRYYQKCIWNNFNEDPNRNPCRFFNWRDDIPREQPQRQPQPQSMYLPLAFASAPASTPTPTPTSTPISARFTHFSVNSTPPTPSPRTGRAPVRPCLNANCASHPKGRSNSKCVWQFCKPCCVQTPGRCSSPRHNETASVLNSVTVMARNSGTVAPTSDMLANPSLIPFTYEKPMARMVDVSYALKLQRGDHETAVSDHFQQEGYRKAQVNAVKARVWLETDGESITVILTVPTFPWFHPQDCPPLILLLDSINGADWSTFGYWDPADGWVITDAPIEIKDAQSILCLRLPNVKDCLNGPRSKRRLSDTLVYSPRAVRLRPDHPTQSRPQISPINFHPTIFSTPNKSRDLPNSQLITLAGVEDADDSDIEIVTPLATPSVSSSQQTQKSKFPLKYAYQMDQGFTAMAVATTGNVQQKFAEAFGVPWTRSSYYTHLDIWSTMRTDSPDALAYAVRIFTPQSGLSLTFSRYAQRTLPGLQMNHVKALRPTPQTFSSAMKMLVNLEGLLVSWEFILNGRGPHSNEKSAPVDLKLRQLFKMDLISIPIQILQRLSQWRGDVTDYDGHTSIGEYVSYAPGSDVKLYDPKAVVVNLLGDARSECSITRFNELDISDLLWFHGTPHEEDPNDDSIDDSSEPDMPTLQTLDSNKLITVSVLTQEFVMHAVLTKPFQDAHEEENYAVTWVLPGYPIIKRDGIVGDVLYIHHQDDAPVGQFTEIVDEEHLLPALGPPKALRVLLFVAPYEKKVKELTEIEKKNVLIAEYLADRHSNDFILDEIRAALSAQDQKTKGRTPLVWERWTTRLKAVLDQEYQVSPLWSVEEVRKKKITAKAIAVLVHASGDWVSKCLVAALFIHNHRTKVWMIKYLRKDDLKSAVGIDNFIKEMRGPRLSAGQPQLLDTYFSRF